MKTSYQGKKPDTGVEDKRVMLVAVRGKVGNWVHPTTTLSRYSTSKKISFKIWDPPSLLQLVAINSVNLWIF